MALKLWLVLIFMSQIVIPASQDNEEEKEAENGQGTDDAKVGGSSAQGME